MAVAHDYLTQRGGAERVVLSMLAAFPDAPLYTSVYDPKGTYPAFADHDVRPLPMNRFGFLARDHRRNLPVLAPLFGRLRVDAEVVLCSSSGWSHGLQTAGRKIVYCHGPARWLYQRDRYVRELPGSVQLVVAALSPYLRRWDAAAAASAHRYLTNSRSMRDWIREIYGIEASVLPPPQSLDATGGQQEVEGLTPGFVLCVSRLLPYKNLDAVLSAFHRLPGHRLVVVGDGPDRIRLESLLRPNTCLLRTVPDAQLRWLYSNCLGLVAASYEDYGLTPAEAAAFGKPTVALRFGGYLDTVAEDVTGLFFDDPRPELIADAIKDLTARSWSPSRIARHAAHFDEGQFIHRLRAVVAGVDGYGP